MGCKGCEQGMTGEFPAFIPTVRHPGQRGYNRRGCCMRLCKMAHFCALCAFLRFFVRFCAFLPAKMACRQAQIRTELCRHLQKKKRFYATPPLVVPPFACHRWSHSAWILGCFGGSGKPFLDARIATDPSTTVLPRSFPIWEIT